VAKHGMRLRGWWATELDGSASQISYASNGRKGYSITTATATTTTITTTVSIEN
jgi:hypothetical protein